PLPLARLHHVTRPRERQPDLPALVPVRVAARVIEVQVRVDDDVHVLRGEARVPQRVLQPRRRPGVVHAVDLAELRVLLVAHAVVDQHERLRRPHQQPAARERDAVPLVRRDPPLPQRLGHHPEHRAAVQPLEPRLQRVQPEPAQRPAAAEGEVGGRLCGSRPATLAHRTTPVLALALAPAHFTPNPSTAAATSAGAAAARAASATPRVPPSPRSPAPRAVPAACAAAPPSRARPRTRGAAPRSPRRSTRSARPASGAAPPARPAATAAPCTAPAPPARGPSPIPAPGTGTSNRTPRCAPRRPGPPAAGARPPRSRGSAARSPPCPA